MTDTVDTAIYKMSVQGGEQITAATAAVDRHVVIEERLTAATRTSADAMDRLLGRLDPRIKAEQQLQTVLARINQFEDEGVGSMAQRAQAQALAVERYNSALARLGSPAAVGGITKVAKATELSTFAMQGLSFQINDIAQGLATGQSPFRTIVQQGSQIVQYFGPGVGVAAALRATGAAIGSFLLNPINLAVIAIAGAAGAIETLWNSVGGGVQVEDVLRRHKQLVEEIAAAYGGATAAAKNYGHEAERVLQFQAQEAAKVLRAQILVDEQDALGSLYGSTGALRTTPQGISIFDHLQESIRQGRVGILQFRQDLVDFGNSIPIAGLDAFGQHLPKADMQALIDKTLQATKALADMELQLQRTKSPSTVPGPGELAGDQSVQAPSRPVSAAARAANAAADRIKGVTDALAFQSAQLGRTGRDQEIFNALQQAGVTINSKWGQIIAQNAGYLYDQRQALDRVNERLATMKSAATDFVGGFLQDMRQGKSALDALAGSLDRLASKLLDLATNSLVDQLFGRLTGALGGGWSTTTAGGAIVGGLTASSFLHGGGIVGDGGVKRYVHSAYFDTAPRFHSGLAPDEFPAILQRGESVIPRGGGAGGSTVVHLVTNIDARGAGPGVAEELRKELDRRDRKLQAAFERMQRDPRWRP